MNRPLFWDDERQLIVLGYPILGHGLEDNLSVALELSRCLLQSKQRTRGLG